MGYVWSVWRRNRRVASFTARRTLDTFHRDVTCDVLADVTGHTSVSARNAVSCCIEQRRGVRCATPTSILLSPAISSIYGAS